MNLRKEESHTGWSEKDNSSISCRRVQVLTQSPVDCVNTSTAAKAPAVQNTVAPIVAAVSHARTNTAFPNVYLPCFASILQTDCLISSVTSFASVCKTKERVSMCVGFLTLNLANRQHNKSVP
eukprot:3526831-Amphidinium_carterae.1